MKVDVVFISNRDDISVEYLIAKLRKRTKKYLRLNSEDINRIEFDIKPSGQYICSVDGSTYDLSDVKTVVFKRTPVKFDGNKSPDTPFLNGERRHFLEGLYLSIGKSSKWINPLSATHLGERKLFQLQAAKKLGLTIPNSLITNSPIKATRFLMKQRQSIIKPISNGLQVLDDATYSIYTSKIDRNYFLSFDQSKLFDTPVFLQETIANKADIRVTMVGNKIFSVAIEKNDQAEVDWRKPAITKKYRVTDLPARLTRLLLKLNKELDLVYSAVDLILTPDNQYVFLEVNPVGEWVWLERDLKLEISTALIDEMLWKK